MFFHHDHTHTSNISGQLQPGKSPELYAAVVGTIVQDSEKPITGRSGDHLQFYLDIGNGLRYQVDVNTQSVDGSAVDVYIADQDLGNSAANTTDPFGPPAYGVFPNAQLSYQAMGLSDANFAPVTYFRLDGQLKAALSTSTFVTVYGLTFEDGDNVRGVHETHFNEGKTNQDGAVVVYWTDSSTGNPKRTWFFFKFNNQHIG
ncbi:DUF2278 family protein [Dyella nitratireducens]|uniref:Uncharacterized protein n=1 Tax=Dyella nitratireducens TaxID=1849580 RepID=A0ABQ1FIQ0_9GAMM|nr:DUF2278 family protein [Dyella nitratireducens]GGA16921.1 hypothetical protein GCM10010981_00800 [Dyella nitratireducens]GLQ44859.1 hypothetical protein GCM10007902_47090 [Dyella nitratireducens]